MVATGEKFIPLSASGARDGVWQAEVATLHESTEPTVIAADHRADVKALVLMRVTDPVRISEYLDLPTWNVVRHLRALGVGAVMPAQVKPARKPPHHTLPCANRKSPVKTVLERVTAALKRKPGTAAEVADRIGASPNAVHVMLRAHPELFAKRAAETGGRVRQGAVWRWKAPKRVKT